MMSAWAHSLIVQKLSMVVFISWVIKSIYVQWKLFDDSEIPESETAGEAWRRISWTEVFKLYDIDLRGHHLTFYPTVTLTPDGNLPQNGTNQDEEIGWLDHPFLTSFIGIFFFVIFLVLYKVNKI